MKPLLGRHGRLAAAALLAVILPSCQKAAAPAGPRAFFPIYENRKGGFIDDKGRVVIAPRFEAVREFHEGLAAVKEGGAFGYITPNGDFAIQPAYEDAGDFHDGRAFVMSGDEKRWGVVNSTGDMTFEPRWRGANTLKFSDGFALVPAGERAYRDGFEFINTFGGVAPFGQFPKAEPFSEGLAAVSRDGETYGVIDTSGAEVIAPISPRPFRFSNGLAAVEKDGKFGYIDIRGEWVIPARYPKAGDFDDGLAPVYDQGGWRAIDKQGNEVFRFPLDVDHVEKFSEGVVVAWKTARAGYVDRTGKAITPYIFEEARDFRNGLAFAISNAPPLIVYLDREGRYVWKGNAWGEIGRNMP